MASKPQVTLTFAGDSDKLERTFDRVGQGARSMSQEVETASRSFDTVGESTDGMATKAGTATGAFGALASGVDLVNLRGQQRLVSLGREVDAIDEQIGALDKNAAGYEQNRAALEAQKAALEDKIKAEEESQQKTEGMTTALMAGMLAVDAFSGVMDFATLALKSNILQTIAHTTVSGIAKAATATWTAAQWLLNAALTLNPIGLVVIAIVALIAIVVVIATKTDWFSKAWNASWSWIKNTAVSVWEWLKGLPDRLGSAFARIPGLLTWPFRTAFNAISDAWNNTIGRLSWSVPGWVPGIGGNTISAPRLPRFHTGGTVPGPPGSEMLAILQAGERVVTPGGSAGGVIQLRGDGSRTADFLIEILSDAIRHAGGNVQAVLGVNDG